MISMGLMTNRFVGSMIPLDLPKNVWMDFMVSCDLGSRSGDPDPHHNLRVIAHIWLAQPFFFLTQFEMTNNRVLLPVNNQVK